MGVPSCFSAGTRSTAKPTAVETSTPSAHRRPVGPSKICGYGESVWRFCFGLLDNPEFGENAVREELIAPILEALGYAASLPYQIIRSRKLEYPYAYFGTVRKDITIIPNYCWNVTVSRSGYSTRRGGLAGLVQCRR